MKKLSSLLLTCILAFLVVGCGERIENQNDKLSIVATNFPCYDFARQIAGDRANISMLLPAGSESHSFEPSPQDIIKIQNSDMFIYVGGESDEWVDDILEGIDTSKTRIITLIDCVVPLEEEIVDGMEEQGEEESDEPEFDEHVWTDPNNAKLIVEKIANNLSEIDNENADYYDANLSKYSEKLVKLDMELQEIVDNAKRKTIIFADRFPFRYLAYRYGLEYFAAFPGCSTETEASAKTIAFLVDKIKEENIPVVFHIELNNQKMANAISEQTGAEVMELHAVHNVTKDDFNSGIGYVELMSRNLIVLEEALN